MNRLSKEEVLHVANLARLELSKEEIDTYAIKLKEYKKIVGTKSYTLKTNKNTYVWKNKNI